MSGQASLPPLLEVSFTATKQAVLLGAYLGIFTLVMVLIRLYQLGREVNSLTTFSGTVIGCPNPGKDRFCYNPGCTPDTQTNCNMCKDGCKITVACENKNRDTIYIGEITVFENKQLFVSEEVFFDESKAIKPKNVDELIFDYGVAIPEYFRDPQIFQRVKLVPSMYGGTVNEFNNVARNMLAGAATSAGFVILLNWYLRSEKTQVSASEAGVKTLISVIGLGGFVSAVLAAARD